MWNVRSDNADNRVKNILSSCKRPILSQCYFLLASFWKNKAENAFQSNAARSSRFFLTRKRPNESIDKASELGKEQGVRAWRPSKAYKIKRIFQKQEMCFKLAHDARRPRTRHKVVSHMMLTCLWCKAASHAMQGFLTNDARRPRKRWKAVLQTMQGGLAVKNVSKNPMKWKIQLS